MSIATPSPAAQTRNFISPLQPASLCVRLQILYHRSPCQNHEEYPHAFEESLRPKSGQQHLPLLLNRSFTSQRPIQCPLRRSRRAYLSSYEMDNPYQPCHNLKMPTCPQKHFKPSLKAAFLQQLSSARVKNGSLKVSSIDTGQSLRRRKHRARRLSLQRNQ